MDWRSLALGTQPWVNIRPGDGTRFPSVGGRCSGGLHLSLHRTWRQELETHRDCLLCFQPARRWCLLAWPSNQPPGRLATLIGSAPVLRPRLKSSEILPIALLRQRRFTAAMRGPFLGCWSRCAVNQPAARRADSFGFRGQNIGVLCRYSTYDWPNLSSSSRSS